MEEITLTMSGQEALYLRDMLAERPIREALPLFQKVSMQMEAHLGRPGKSARPVPVRHPATPPAEAPAAEKPAEAA